MLNLLARLEQAILLSLTLRAGNTFDCRVSVNRLAHAATLSLRAAVVSLSLAGAASIAIAQESNAAATAEDAAQASSAASAASSSAELDSAEPDNSAPLKIRAQSELKYISDPQPLIMASPFPGNIPVDLATSLASSTRLWTLKRSFQNPARNYTIAGRSPLIRGGVGVRLANQVLRETSTNQIDSFEDEVSLADSLAEMMAAESEAAIARLEAIDNYNAVIADLEGDGGAWNGSLVEELTSLGTLLQQQGSHEEAIKVFDRAVHINRISLGLHSVEQVPAIESKIQSYLALNQWQDADLTFEYLYYIQRRAYGTRDPRLISVLNSIAEWNLRAFHLGHGEALGMRLNNALMFWNAAARMVKTHFGPQDERFVTYLRGIANSSYLLSRNPEMMADLGRPEFRNELAVNRVHLGQSDSYESRGYASGARALTEILRYEIDKRDDVLALADAFTNLADWYLIFGRRRAAEEQYSNAWRLLANQPNADALHKAYFGRIVPMPSFVGERNRGYELDVVRQSDEPLDSDYADLIFDVTDTGVVRDVRTLSAETEDNKNQLSRLRRVVRSSHFRPIIIDGIPQRSENNVFRYRYWY
jgi:tetratricopeptide (TPR) repeat protein